MFFILLSCLLVIFHSTAYLDLSVNSLMGTIPSEVGLLTKLSESSICLIACCNDCVVLCVFHCALMIACPIHSTATLALSRISLTGTIPSEIALLSNLCESSVVWLLVVMIVLSCMFFIVFSCLLVIFILQLGCFSTTIISRVNSRVLTLLMIIIVGSRVILEQTHILKLAVPFRET